MPEVQRKIKGNYNNFNPIASNISHLIVLQGIVKTKSTDFNKLGEYITNMGIDNLKFSYDELGMTILSMFNSIFLSVNRAVSEITSSYPVSAANGEN